MSQKPQPRNWRAQPPAKTAYSREWRGSGGTSTVRYSRQFKLRMIGAVLVTTLIVIILLLLPHNTPSPVRLITFGIGAYGGQTNPRGIPPVNPFGEQDASSFEVLSQASPRQFPEIRNEVNSLNADQFIDFWKKETGSADLVRQNLIVFCSMHGMVQPKTGEIKLFAIDATSDDLTKIIDLKELVAILQKSPAKRVLLILDAARLETNWKLGVLWNDIAEQLASEWPARILDRKTGHASDSKDKVAILFAASPGQRSWPRHERSAFVEYLVQGLLHDADGWKKSNGQAADSGDHDSRITMSELVAYADAQIKNWSRQRYGTSQSLQLLGNVTDFDLAGISSTDPESLKSLLAKPPTDLKEVGGAAQAAAKSQVDQAKAEVKKSADPNAKKEGSGTAEEKESPKEKPDAEKAPQAGENTAEETPASVSNSLAELWKVRDQWRDESAREITAVSLNQPFAWRAFEARLGLADSLRRGGQEKLSGKAIKEAKVFQTRISDQAASIAGLKLSTDEAQRLRECGLGIDPARPNREALAAAKKRLYADAGEVDNSPPDMIAIRDYLLQEFRELPPEEKDLVKIRPNLARLPQSPDVLILRDVMDLKPNDIQYTIANHLPEYFRITDRYRQLVLHAPEAWRLAKDDIQAAIRSLIAAERWMMSAGVRRTEINDWLQKAAAAVSRAEQKTSLARQAFELLCRSIAELPATAEWVASRSGDDDRRTVTWLQQWAQNGLQNQWDLTSLQNNWPENSTDSKDVERIVLTQLVDLLKLKSILIDGPKVTPELEQIVREGQAHRAEFWRALSQKYAPPRLENARNTDLRESVRLLEQSWVPLDLRGQHDRFQSELDARLVPAKRRGSTSDNDSSTGLMIDSLRPRAATMGATWQGFWAVATLKALSLPEAEAGLSPVWKKWSQVFELSSLPVDESQLNAMTRDKLRAWRTELGEEVRQQFHPRKVESASLARIQLSAAFLDPFLIPESDPDTLLLNQRRSDVASWLNLFAEEEWRQRDHVPSKGKSREYIDLTDKSESLAETLDRDHRADPKSKVRQSESARLDDFNRMTFNTDRQGQLTISAKNTNSNSNGLAVQLSAVGVRMLDQSKRLPLEKGLARDLPADGKLSLQFAMDEKIETLQTMLVVLTEKDGFPVDFRSVSLIPPFDEKGWHIELADAKTQVPLETGSFARSSATKVFMLPTSISQIKANLVRPKKDVTSSVSVSIYRLTDSTQRPDGDPIRENLEIKLEPGVDKTAIEFEYPEPPKEKPATKDDTPAASPIDIGMGLRFRVTPEGHAPLDFVLKPTFYSPDNFVNEPKPAIINDRFTLELDPPTASKLPPMKTPIELHVPDSIKSSLKGSYTLVTSLENGQRVVVDCPLPKDWSERAFRDQMILSLDVAGLPHAYLWKINPTGDLERISGQQPNLMIQLVQPVGDGKTPPRLKPVILKGKEPMNLLLQLNALELDRRESVNDWILKYSIRSEAAAGTGPASLQGSWKIGSSTQRLITVDSIKNGVWKVQTRSSDYAVQQSADSIRGLGGRFQVQADLLTADEPEPIRSTSFIFAIDDDKPPEAKLTWNQPDPQSPYKDLDFRIEATDLESGIQRISYGFDLDGDEKLDESKEMLGFEPREIPGVNLDPPVLDRRLRIQRSNLPKLAPDKTEEKKVLVLKVENGLGIVNHIPIKVVFSKAQKVNGVLKEPTRTMIVKLNNIRRYTDAAVTVSGPEDRRESPSKEERYTVTFKDLKPGRYTVEANVVINKSMGIRAKGKREVDLFFDDPNEKPKVVELDVVETK